MSLLLLFPPPPREAQLSASDVEDTAAATLVAFHVLTLAGTEPLDTSDAVVSVVVSAAADATEQPDYTNSGAYWSGSFWGTQYWSSNYWGLPADQVYISVTSAAASAALDATESSDVFEAVAELAVSASFDVLEAVDEASFSALAVVAFALDATEAADAAAFEATAGDLPELSAALDATEAQDEFSAVADDGVEDEPVSTIFWNVELPRKKPIDVDVYAREAPDRARAYVRVVPEQRDDELTLLLSLAA